jgi:hypothetical protein
MIENRSGETLARIILFRPHTAADPSNLLSGPRARVPFLKSEILILVPR